MKPLLGERTNLKFDSRMVFVVNFVERDNFAIDAVPDKGMGGRRDGNLCRFPGQIPRLDEV